jgi:hypothetical protein
MAITYHPNNISAPAAYLRAVTPHDTNPLTDGACRALWVGGAGNLSLIAIGDTSAVTISGVAAGTMVPISCSIVRSTGTTATLIVALY